MLKINYLRIVANFGTAFFTTFGAAMSAGLMEPKAFFVASLVAFIHGGLAAFQELSVEATRVDIENGDAPPPVKTTVEATAPPKVPLMLLF